MMIDTPFALFQPYAARLSVAFLAKADRVRTDQDIAQRLGAGSLASLWQVHGPTCVTVTTPEARGARADAAATATLDLTLVIRNADCQTFVFYAPTQQCVAVAHAGWRGLLAGILPATVRTLQETWGSSPGELLVGAAPSLCMRCAEFTDPVRELTGVEERFFEGRCADLRGIALDQLLRAGVRAEHFERMPGCTRCEPATYWTYRGGDRESVSDGWCNVLACTLRDAQR